MLEKKNEEISKLKNERENMSKEKQTIWTTLEKEKKMKSNLKWLGKKWKR